MSSVLSTDQKLLQIVTAPATATPGTLDSVIQRMESIDSLLPDDDGLKWFNRLYLYVTKDVKLHYSTDGWKNAAWLTRLDVDFAGLYFSAVANAVGRTGAVPKSWQVLFDFRHQKGIARIQFALAGMNAHINHDLALALNQVDAELHRTLSLSSPEHDDYERVNGLLEEVMPKALEFLATGILGLVAESTGKIGPLLAIWNIRAARDLAWDFSSHLRSLPGFARGIALSMQDKVTGALGRSLLRAL